jgi:hypothetical protein
MQQHGNFVNALSTCVSQGRCNTRIKFRKIRGTEDIFRPKLNIINNIPVPLGTWDNIGTSMGQTPAFRL